MDFGTETVEAVRGYEYVSLDVYDTLLVRPYARPKDVFIHIETKENAPGFTEERIAAEKRCMASPYPTTLDRIYEEIPERFRHLKGKELEYESNPVCPARILRAYREILKDHRVAIISDMYLPQQFIEGLLKKNGIDGYERFYLSSEVGCSKGRGDMYDHVLKDLGIEKSQIIHVGDNLKTDYLNPKKQGFNALLTEKPIDAYFRKNRGARRFYRKTRSLERSIIVGMDAIRMFGDAEEDFWKDVSYRFGGPLVYDYARFVSDNLRKDDIVMLAARDGYNIEKVLNIIRPDVETHYVYVPRILNVLIGSSFAQHWGYKRRIVNWFYGDVPDPDSFYDSHLDEIETKRKELLEAFRRNIVSGTGEPRSIASIDVTSMKYSSQKLIGDVFPGSDVMGIYYFLLHANPAIPHRAYHVRTRLIKLADNINITEFFMTSPEPPITGVDMEGRPQFREPCPEERMRLDIYDKVTEGETEYARDIERMFGDRMIPLTFENIHRWIIVLTLGSGSSVRGRLAEMKWAVDADHSSYISVIYHPRDTLFHAKRTILDLGWFFVSRLRGER